MSMDGKNSTILFNNETEVSVVWPSALTLDYSTETLYWTDAFKDYIGKSRMDGSDPVIIQNLTNRTLNRSHAFAMDFHEGQLYWSDWLSDAIFTLRVGAANGNVQRLVNLSMDPGGIHVAAASRQPPAESKYYLCR